MVKRSLHCSETGVVLGLGQNTRLGPWITQVGSEIYRVVPLPPKLQLIVLSVLPDIQASSKRSILADAMLVDQWRWCSPDVGKGLYHFRLQVEKFTFVKVPRPKYSLLLRNWSRLVQSLSRAIYKFLTRGQH